MAAHTGLDRREPKRGRMSAIARIGSDNGLETWLALALFCALLANVGLSMIEQRFTRWRDLQASVR